MPIETFEIQVDNPNRSYFAGQEVRGQVNILLTERPKLIHGIKLKLVGKGKTHWKESGGRSASHYSEEETYIDQKVYLLGYETENSEMTLETGTYAYKFSFNLPGSLPSSISTKYGGVKYHLEGTITRNRKSNFSSKLPFTVNGILDLNLESGVKSEGEISKEKVVCCFCCASGPLGFTFKLPKKGFVPGERIGFLFHMYNHSNRLVYCTAVALIQELTYKADLDHSKVKTVEICDIEGPKLNAGDTSDWIVTSDISTLTVPSLPPSRLDGCRIIHISYSIKVRMEAKDSSTLKGYIPITIGTIPLRDDFCQITSSNEITNDIESPSQGNLRNSNEICIGLPQYPDLPPPSYEEAVNGLKEEDTESTSSEPPDYGSLDWKSFIPRYVHYKFNAK